MHTPSAHFRLSQKIGVGMTLLALLGACAVAQESGLTNHDYFAVKDAKARGELPFDKIIPAGATLDEGGIVRGPKERKRIALEFTGHEFAEGGQVILDELAKHHARASFFLTGDFLANPEFKPLAQRIIREGHYLGPHSDKHLLYCSWADRNKTLVTREQFTNDLGGNLAKIAALGVNLSAVRYWLPAYEYYNRDVVKWSSELGLVLVNYTPGTRANADYTEDKAANFVSSQAILESILKREREDPDGLNGFLLLLHLGSGTRRTDKMPRRFGELLEALSAKGYQFVRVDELPTAK